MSLDHLIALGVPHASAGKFFYFYLKTEGMASAPPTWFSLVTHQIVVAGRCLGACSGQPLESFKACYSKGHGLFEPGAANAKNGSDGAVASSLLREMTDSEARGDKGRIENRAPVDRDDWKTLDQRSMLFTENMRPCLF